MNFSLSRIALTAISATMLCGAVTPAFAVAPGPAPAATKTTSDGPPSLFEEARTTPQQQAFLDVIIKVPHKTHPKDTFNLYPYPVKPPKSEHATLLPETEKSMKQLLLSTGYHNRMNPDKPYQLGGWRWQYCFQTAVRKSGLGVPHSIISEYAWARDITPYAQAETKKWNEFEDQRWLRYKKAVAEFERNHADIESDATQQGLVAMELPKRGYGWIQQNIPTGTWWLTATRKVPGLTYYWQVPLTAAPGEKIKIELNELNALIIEGGW
jgi:hypothetical protein